MLQNPSTSLKNAECPVCLKCFPPGEIENHVNRCLFLSSASSSTDPGQISNQTSENKRTFGIFNRKSPSVASKKQKLEFNGTAARGKNGRGENHNNNVIDLSDDEITETANIKKEEKNQPPQKEKLNIPLAEKMRPNVIEEYVGQNHIMDKNTVLRSVLNTNEIPSMILWGPPGCGKTTLAHIIANRCKSSTQNTRFVKLSATMCGVNDVKEMVKVAKNEMQFKRKTILFMDEIHRFNKLQQDTFLPHVENGTITLIGATTENPSFSLNSALLSRCRVIVLEKLDVENMFQILERALRFYDTLVLEETDDIEQCQKLDIKTFQPQYAIDKKSVMWLAEMCDGDARIALNTLQLTMQTIQEQLSNDGEPNTVSTSMKLISLDHLKEGIKKSHLLYDRKGDQHYDCVSAMHKSIRASDENAALYWCTRMMEGGEDPRYICRRLVRAASEDIGLADPTAVSVALAAYQSVQLIGMPESDCIIAQCAIYLARAPKSRESYDAMQRCRRDIKEWRGPLPSVPLHLRNAPTKLMKDLGFGSGYNMEHKDESGLQYMPEGMEDRNYFD